MTPARRRLSAALLVLAMGAVGGCASAGASSPPSRTSATAVAASSPASASVSSSSASSSSAGQTASAAQAPRRPQPTAPRDHYPGRLTGAWQRMASVGGRPAMWIAERSGVTLVRMDQHLVHLALHAGSADPGGTGWRYGAQVAGREIHHLILGFNGGFKFSTDSGGFQSFGRTAVPLTAGLASIVTYTDGRTQIGTWGAGVPAHGRRIASVRQNLHLLIDQGRPAASVNCGEACWGATIGGASAVARSGVGILGNGQLVWAAGENLTVAQFADAMAGAGVQRGVELDINPDWVAGYLYVHHAKAPVTPVPVVPGQYGIYGHLLIPYSRDFFTVLAN